MKLALLSDTHGLLRPTLWPHLDGVDRILHAGDVGPVSILDELEAVAPVTAVWGNTDGFDVRARVPEVARIDLAGRSVVVLHGHRLGNPTPEALARLHPEADLIVFGHTHVPVIRTVGRGLAVNPGSCGPRRRDLAPTLVRAEFLPSGVRTQLVTLDEV